MSEINAGDKAINRLNSAVDAFEDIMTAPEGTWVGVPNHTPQISLAERVKRSLDALTESPAESARKASQSEKNAAASAASAKVDADRAQLANPDSWESAPYPDVWIPFNDSLKMEAGFGAQDTITVGAETIKLPSRSATFTRASTATYIDKSGVLQTAAINEPRFERDGLLIEGQSTNVFKFSEEFLGAVQTGGKFNSYNSNLIGTLNPDKSVTFVNNPANTGTGVADRRMLVSSNITLLANTTYTVSIMGKGGAHQVSPYGSGVITMPVLNLTFPEDKFGVQTFRITTNATGGNFQCEIYANPLGALHTTYDGSFSIRYFQLEALPFATSYIPTNGAAATRAADNCSIPLKNNIPLFPSEMSLSMEVNQPQDTKTEYRTLMEYAGTTLMIYANTNQLRREGAVDQNNNINISTAAFNTPGKTLFAASQSASSDGEILTVVNGTLGRYTGGLFFNPVTSAPMFNIGRSGIRNVWGHVRNFRIWHRALTDAQLKSLR